MSDIPIKRMNFLKGNARAITYNRLVSFIIAWVFSLSLLYAVQIARQFYMQKVIDDSAAVIGEYEAEKDQQLQMIKKVDHKKVDFTSQAGLSTIIQNRPKWSEMLKHLSKVLPAKVWLNSIKSSNEGGGNYKVELLGGAKSRRYMSKFVMNCEKDELFSDTSLVSSKYVGSKTGTIEFVLVFTPILNAI